MRWRGTMRSPGMLLACWFSPRPLAIVPVFFVSAAGVEAAPFLMQLLRRVHSVALPAGQAVKLFFAALGKTFDDMAVDHTRIITNAGENGDVFGKKRPAREAIGNEPIKALADKYTTQSQYLQVKNISAHFTIPSNDNNKPFIDFEYITEDFITARIRIVPPNSNNYQIHEPASKFISQNGEKWVESLASVYDLTTRAELVESLLPQIERDKLRYQQIAASDLATVLAKLQDVAANQIIRQTEYFNQKTKELDEQNTARDQERRKQYDARVNELEAERAALAKQKTDMDLQKSTDARRKHLTDLKTLLDEDFTIKVPTLNLRSYNLIACIIGAVAGIGLLITGVIKLFNADKMEWHYWSMFIGGSVLFGTTLVYYLRWNDSWFRKLAESEFFNRKLKIDSISSSWIAEMLLEWTDEKSGRQFPPQLLRSFSTGLFQTGDEKETEHHPIGQLLHTIGKLDSLKINKDGLELKQKEK
jgi:hypothetical protein